MFIPDLLKHKAEKIRILEPDRQDVPFDRDSWGKHIDRSGLGDIELGDIFDGLAGYSIRRKDIFDRTPLDSDRLVPCTKADVARWVHFFILVMIWGYGKVGAGPWRVNRMLHTPNFQTILCRAGEECFSGLFLKAYQTLQEIDRLGPAFASKLLYFYCHKFNAATKPLIFDSMVIDTMRSFNWPNLNVDYIANGVNPRPQPYAYGQYLILMHNWANALGCSPDQLEYFMWATAMGIPI